MKIIEIIPQLGQGGAERFVIDLCNEMSKEHDVILVIFHNIDQHGFFSKELNKNVRLICMNKRIGTDWRLFIKLRKFIMAEKPDIVHTHLRGILYSFLAYLIPTKIKFIHTIHNDAEKEAIDSINKICRKFAFRTKRVHPVTISEESQRSFHEFYKLSSTLIYNGRPDYDEHRNIQKIETELNTLKKQINTKLIVNIARIQPQKNQLCLAKAVENLNNNGYNIELAIIGSKADNNIIKEIENLNSSHIHLLGERTNPRDYMRAADGFCLSSIYEGMPITLIECFSVGAIPLCTPVGGIINMIKNKENGLLANGITQKDIEELLISFFNLTPEEKERIKYNSKKSFSHFKMKTCADKYVNLMKELQQSHHEI